MYKEYKTISIYNLIVYSFIILPFSILGFIIFGYYGLFTQMISNPRKEIIVLGIFTIPFILGAIYSINKLIEYKKGKFIINKHKLIKVNRNGKNKEYNLKQIKKAKKIYNKNTNSLLLIFNDKTKLNINFLNKKELKEISEYISTYTKIQHNLFNRINF